MDGSDAMVLSMIVGIPGLAYIYMEPMERARDNLHSSGLTYSPQHRYIRPQPDDGSTRRPISAQSLLGMDGSDAMALSMILSIPGLAYTYMEPMETATSNLHLHASGLTYSPQAQGC